MSEDSSIPHTTQGGDKAQAPATFSSFINKNTSGKKFAPKAARRRPGAAAAPALKSTVPVSVPVPVPLSASTPSVTEPHRSQAEPQSSNASAITPAVTAQLPTPTPTQELTPQTAAAVASEPTSTPASVVEQSQPVEDDIQDARLPRRLVESPSRQSTPMVPVAVMVPRQDVQTGDITSQQPVPQAEGASAPSTGAGSGNPSIDVGTAFSTETEIPAQQNRRRRTLPWTAVNDQQEEGGEASEAAGPSAKKKRAPPKPRGRKEASKITGEDEGQQENGDEEEAELTHTRPSTGAKGKRKADAAEGGGGGGGAAELPAKKPRKPRRDKGKQRAEEREQVDEEDVQQRDAAAKPKGKPRAPKRKKSTPGQGEEGSVEPKRRGRPPREDTPSGAEDEQIDPDMICMDDLASRNIRIGKLSRREREMRKIDWEAVKQRRREEDARHISTKETQAVVDKLLESGEVEPVPTGPRYHVVDGRIELIQDSGTIDRERDADREIDAMVITEEDDLTTRITSRSFMKNNKRFPNEFVLPGQGKRWNHHSTDLFYQGLRSFGTDFQMIAHMFPGMTRRSIKTKFTREERENPEIVRDCLRGKSELASHWDHFLAASQLEEDSFADADAIKRDLEEEEIRMREQINEALKEKEEREKQKKLAGLTEDGDGAGDKENGKGKKKRKQKDKTVTFQDQGMEVLGDVDDDPNWGQE